MPIIVHGDHTIKAPGFIKPRNLILLPCQYEHGSCSITLPDFCALDYLLVLPSWEENMKVFFLIIYLFIFWLHWVLVAASGLSLVAVHTLLIVGASRCGARALGRRASVVAARGPAVVEHRLSCSMECGIFLDQANSYPLHHQGSPRI